MENKITVDEAIEANRTDNERLDPNKTCETCKYERVSQEDKPCIDCISSFFWRVFDPSNWEMKIDNHGE